MNFRFFFILILYAFVAAFLLASCQNRKPAIDTFGQLDSTMVAADTTMQVNMDRSYEYLRSLPESDTVVFDFLAYDKPKGSSNPEWESKFIVIRRTRVNQDTVIRGLRSGVVQQLWLSDINGNGKSEIMFYEYPKAATDKGATATFFAYETNDRQPAQKLAADLVTDQAHYAGRDSFFANHNYLIRRYSVGTDPAAEMWQSYRLSGGHLVLDREKKAE